MRAYFPSSSNSWYSSVNRVQIVKAILKQVPRRSVEGGCRCTERRIRCTHRLHRVVNTARFCTERANQTEGFMHSESASAGSMSTGICGKNAASVRASKVLFPRCLVIFFTSSGWSQLVDAAFCVHFGVFRACSSCCWVLSLCTHQTPHYRTYLQLCARSRPFACILSQANGNEQSDKNNTRGIWRESFYLQLNKMTQIINNQSYKSEIIKGIYCCF